MSPRSKADRASGGAPPYRCAEIAPLTDYPAIQ
jgi:hypothetical protein